MMIRRIQSRWNAFFFAEEVPYGMALVRITLPLVLLIDVLPRWWFARELFSIDGAPAPLWVNYGNAPLIPELSGATAVALYTLLIACLLTACVGWMTRTSLAVACVLYAGFGLLDAVGTLTKYTVIASHVLFLLAFSQCGAIWSVDAWLRRQNNNPRVGTSSAPKSPVWPTRLLQLLIGLIYLGAAFTKMHTPAYFSGDQLAFWMLADMNFHNRVGQYLSMYPPFLTVTAYLTIVWEVLFVYLIWSPLWRLPALALGVVFHIMTYFTLGLTIFPLVYLAAYLAFLQPAEVERLLVWGKRLLAQFGLYGGLVRSGATVVPFATMRQRPAYAAAVWGMVMAAVAVIGVEVEHHRDVYGRRTAVGPLPLKPLDPELAAQMLGPSRKLRPQDLYYAFDIGTTTLAGLLSDRRDSFRYGEQAIVQCTLQPPHPDMWVELNVLDRENHVLRRIGQVVPRENLRTEFYFSFDESLEPGTYDFALRYDGVELTRRRVTLAGPAATLTAAR
ncbi:MAG: HTTM domain-containing protein [Planctomycetaceae bacterium]|nr:HTTM domain-containing protein [Planctomycetaceae bacterium]